MTATITAGTRLRSLPAVIPMVLIAVGITLRLVQYVSNRSLYVDEAALALNIRSRSAAELLAGPLDFAQTAAPGFLLLQKGLTSLAGDSEYVLRLLPFCAGVLAVPLFWRLARRVLPRPGALIALALFAVSAPVLFFSSDAKPYAIDVLASILVLSAAASWLTGPRGKGRDVRLGLTGAVLPWFSQPALLTMAGVGIALAIATVVRRDRGALVSLVKVGLAWLAGAAPALLFSLRSLTDADTQYMRTFWESGFLPLPPWSREELLWFPATLLRLGIDPLGAFPPFAILFALIVGAVVLARQQPSLLLLITGPIIVTALASAAHRYPFGGFGSERTGRVLLFLVPCFLLLTGAGVAWLWKRLPYASVQGFLVVLLLLPNALMAMSGFPYERQEVRPVLEYLNAATRPGDIVYVYYGARHLMRYYEPRYSLRGVRTVEGICSRAEPRRYLRDLERVWEKPRVWVLYAHTTFRELPLLATYLDQNAVRQAEFRATGAQTVRYDLRRSSARIAPADSLLLPAPGIYRSLDCQGLYDWDGTSVVR